MNYDLLFSPAKIGNVTVKNRIIMEPMCLGSVSYTHLTLPTN